LEKLCTLLGIYHHFISALYIISKNHWGEPSVDGSIILRQIFRKWGMGLWTGLIWLRIDRWREIVNAVMNLRVL
jgi:hypothetical protein